MISHLLRKSNGHLLRKSNGHLIYRARLSGNYIENCHATYTFEYIEGKGYQNTYTIYDVPLNAVGNTLVADYADKVFSKTVVGNFYNTYYDYPKSLPLYYPGGYACVKTVISYTGSGDSREWEIRGVVSQFFSKLLGTTIGATAAGTYSNLLENDVSYPITVHIE